MGILAAHHPDVGAFIGAKARPDALPNFNLSIGASDAFMAAAKAGRTIDLVNPRTGRVTRRESAAELLDRAASFAWRTGDPGLVFLDRINRDNPTPQLGLIEATNPCGEQPLLPYEACCLGSLNLERFVAEREGRAAVDEERLGAAVETAVHLLDNVIDASRYPLPEIERICRGNRKIGLGVMGFADLLIRLGVPYDSEEAPEVAERVMGSIARRADEASARLAARRGAFPNFPGSALERPGARPLRNATRTTVAPTGTISVIAGCSSGIEPLFALSFTRRILEREFREVHPLFREVAEREGLADAAVFEQVAQRGTLQGVDGVPAHLRRLFVTAHEVPPEWHVRLQAAFQRHVDNAVSKTVNLPAHARPEHVRLVFRLAHELGCKGVTVYRYGSKESQMLNINPYCLSCAEDGLEQPARAPAGR
jgi:ribonucleoside-diphosphate reductase alpha chain